MTTCHHERSEVVSLLVGRWRRFARHDSIREAERSAVPRREYGEKEYVKWQH
jgi:hypothetical protein